MLIDMRVGAITIKDEAEREALITLLRHTGRWVRVENPRYAYDRENGDINAGVYYRCSECNSIGYDNDNYCRNCGAYMKEEKKKNEMPRVRIDDDLDR